MVSYFFYLFKLNFFNFSKKKKKNSGNIEVVKWLVEHNINVNIIDNKKETAYDLAKKQHHFDIANYLAVPSGKPLIPM